MSDRDEFERVFKSVFKGHRMTRGSNGDYIGIVPWSAWKIWQAQRPAPVVLHEDMTEDFKEQWQNGLPLDSAEARWAFCGWKAARAQQAGEAVGEIVSIDDSNFISMDDDTLNDLPIGTKLYTHPSASMPNLSTIAQKKLDQMGATVHGVLVKNEAGAWAAVSDAGRVMWLDGFELQAARAQEGGSGEAVAYTSQCVLDGLAFNRANDFPAGGTVLATNLGGGRIPLYTHPPAKVPEGWRHTLEEALAMMTSRPMTLERQADAVTGIRDLLTPTPQPADNWIKCSERLPTEADADMYGKLWCFLPDRQEPRVTQFGFKEVAFFYSRDCTITHWMPTGLKRPNPPEQGAER